MKPTTPNLRKLGLLSYQSAFAANNSRFKIGLWARQTGKDHTATAEAVLDCFHHPGTTWIIVAASERQALESLTKAKEWAAILKFDIAGYNEAPANTPYSVARTASTEIKWSNGSRLIALPANPSTIRGYSANLILTEFAFHENPEALWRAIYPTISNPLRGGAKKLRIISTPNGLTNKFAHLWHSMGIAPVSGAPFGVSPNISSPSARSAVNPLSPSNPAHPVKPVQNSFSQLETGNWKHSKEFSVLSVPSSLPSVLLPSASSAPSALNPFFRSRITIHDAIRGGLPLDAAELQSALNDPEAWAQEYLCEFMDNSTVLLPYDLIETCESSLATERSSLESLSASAIPGNNRPQLYAGIDFARKNHLTVCWILEKLPPNLNPTLNLSPSSSFPSLPSVKNSSVYLTREILCLRNTSTPDQINQLLPRLNLCQKTALDYTGPGIGLGDFLIKQLGYKLELCPFTSSLKAELFPRLAAAFESRELLIPIARDIREDLHSIYRTVTNSGNILYRAHATPDGHSDRSTALALALRAAQSAPVYSAPSSVGRKNPFLRDSRRGNRYLPPERTLAIIY